MAHYQTVIEPKQPAATSAFAKRKKMQSVVHAGLFAAAFLFITAVVCGVFP